MNYKLLRLLKAPMTEENRKEILHEIAQANPQKSEIVTHLLDMELVKKVANIAATYVNTATAAVSKRATWQDLVGTTDIAVELTKLLDNMSLVNYTQAVMLITVALLKEEP